MVRIVRAGRGCAVGRAVDERVVGADDRLHALLVRVAVVDSACLAVGVDGKACGGVDDAPAPVAGVSHAVRDVARAADGVGFGRALRLHLPARAEEAGGHC